jgi:hypothetical protein
MNTLKISDLTITAELDSSTMRAVRGGVAPGAATEMPLLISSSAFKFGNGATISPSQVIHQGLSIENFNGMDSAFDTGVASVITPQQSANNSITFV